MWWIRVVNSQVHFAIFVLHLEVDILDSIHTFHVFWPGVYLKVIEHGLNSTLELFWVVGVIKQPHLGMNQGHIVCLSSISIVKHILRVGYFHNLSLGKDTVSWWIFYELVVKALSDQKVVIFSGDVFLGLHHIVSNHLIRLHLLRRLRVTRIWVLRSSRKR